MEYGSIEREIQIDATPEVVFGVITSPVHIKQWWNADADLEPAAGATGELVWGDRSTPEAHIAPVTVVDADPPRLFSFRWVAPDGEAPTPYNSLLVTFELTPRGAGTVLRLTESGYREIGWEAARLEDTYNDHVRGWNVCMGDLTQYVSRLVATP